MIPGQVVGLRDFEHRLGGVERVPFQPFTLDEHRSTDDVSEVDRFVHFFAANEEGGLWVFCVEAQHHEDAVGSLDFFLRAGQGAAGVGRVGVGHRECGHDGQDREDDSVGALHRNAFRRRGPSLRELIIPPVFQNKLLKKENEKE